MKGAAQAAPSLFPLFYQVKFCRRLFSNFDDDALLCPIEELLGCVEIENNTSI
jgi:hypothetical protein